MGLLLVLAALLSGAGALVWHERAKAGTLAPPLFPPSTFEGVVRDRVYRVHAKLDRGYGHDLPYEALEKDLSDNLRQLGFTEVFLASEDPTDARVWTFVARWGQEAASGVNAPPLAVYELEEVEVPAPVDVPAPAVVLDQGLSFAESNAVSVALARERDPAKLLAFADVMRQDFPIAANLLQAKAILLTAKGFAA